MAVVISYHKPTSDSIISYFHKNVNRQFLRTRVKKSGSLLLLKVVYTKARRSTQFCNTFNIELLYIHFSAPRFVLHFSRRKSNTKINVCKSNTNHLKVKSNTMFLEGICITKKLFYVVLFKYNFQGFFENVGNAILVYPRMYVSSF